MQSTQRKDIGQTIMLVAGFLAAGLFVLVSMAANLKFGLSLSATPFERIIYAALSLAADLMKIALPLVAILLWRNGYRVLSATGAVFWIGLVSFSLAAAVGFAASTRGETVTANRTAIDSRKSWEAKIERVEKELDQLGVPRPGNVIQAEIDTLLRTPGAEGCKVINGPVTREICPRVDALRKERAVADRVADLEAQLVAARKQLQTMPGTATVADPQSATLARILPAGEADIRDMIAFLIAALVETGSALGLTFMALGSRSVPATPAPALQIAKVFHDTERKKQSPKCQTVVTLPEKPADTVTRWAFARLDVLGAGRIQAEIAYQDFIAWCHAEGLNACSRQMFGRRFTEVVKGMGGRKVKINGRAYYEGVVLQGRPAQKQILAAAA